MRYLSEKKDEIVDAIFNYRHVAVVSPTGSGKTELFLKRVTPKELGMNIIFSVPTTELAFNLGLEYGLPVYYNGNAPEMDDEFKRYIVVWDTVGKCSTELLEKSLIVVDEVHLVAMVGFRSRLPIVFEKSILPYKCVFLSGTFDEEVFNTPFAIDKTLYFESDTTKYITIHNIVTGKFQRNDDGEVIDAKVDAKTVHLNFIQTMVNKAVRDGKVSLVVIDNSSVIHEFIENNPHLNIVYRVGGDNKRFKHDKKNEKLFNNGHIDDTVDVIIGTNPIVEGWSLYSEKPVAVIIAGGGESELMTPHRVIQIANRDRADGRPVEVFIERYDRAKWTTLKSKTLKETARVFKKEMENGHIDDNRFYHRETDGSISDLHKVKQCEYKYLQELESVRWDVNASISEFADKVVVTVPNRAWIDNFKRITARLYGEENFTFKIYDEAIVLEPEVFDFGLCSNEDIVKLFLSDALNSSMMYDRGASNAVREAKEHKTEFTPLVMYFDAHLMNAQKFIKLMAEMKFRANEKTRNSFLSDLVNEVHVQDIYNDHAPKMRGFDKVIRLYRAIRKIREFDGDDVREVIRKLNKKDLGVLAHKHKSFTNIYRTRKGKRSKRSVGELLGGFGLDVDKEFIFFDEQVVKSQVARYIEEEKRAIRTKETHRNRAAKKLALLDDELRYWDELYMDFDELDDF